MVREDPNRKGLMFAGTEFGIYVSYDSGDHWQSIQLNLPMVPITDLAFPQARRRAGSRDARAGVLDHGRSGAAESVRKARIRRKKRSCISRGRRCATEGGRGGGGGGRAGVAAGANPPTGAVIEFYLKDRPQGEVTLEFLDVAGKSINKYSSRTAERSPELQAIAEQEAEFNPFAGGGPARVPAQTGMNRFVWDLHYPDATTFPNMILWAGSTRGPMVVPGNYQVRLTVDGKTQTQPFTVVKDPRLKTTTDEFNRQLALALQIRDKLSQTNQAVIDIREAKKQLGEYVSLWKDNPAAKKVVDTAQELTKKLSSVEEELYQVKNQAHEDPLNYPIRLNNRIAALLGVVEGTDAAPTRQSEAVNRGADHGGQRATARRAKTADRRHRGVQQDW